MYNYVQLQSHAHYILCFVNTGLASNPNEIVATHKFKILNFFIHTRLLCDHDHKITFNRWPYEFAQHCKMLVWCGFPCHCLFIVLKTECHSVELKLSLFFLRKLCWSVTDFEQKIHISMALEMSVIFVRNIFLTKWR